MPSTLTPGAAPGSASSEVVLGTSCLNGDIGSDLLRVIFTTLMIFSFYLTHTTGSTRLIPVFCNKKDLMDIPTEHHEWLEEHMFQAHWLVRQEEVGHWWQVV